MNAVEAKLLTLSNETIMDSSSLEIKEGKRTFASMAFCEDSVELPEGFVPCDKDILCGRVS